jgi:uncharacterized protein (TIGR02646 family)
VIRVQKSPTIPEPLSTKGKKARTAHCTAYSRHSEAFHSGEKTFKFDRNIYTHSKVKAQLIIDQHGKCCYCERRIGNKGDIEHFRPKGAVQQSPGKPLIKPGYYWLAYDWNNLYLSCSVCNQHHKQNQFPLEDPETRALNHKGKIEKESRLIIDPSQDSPEDHIGFRGAAVYEITPTGKATISVLQLNHVILEDDRLNYLKHLKICYKILKSSRKDTENLVAQGLIVDAAQLLEEAVQPGAKYSAAARSAIATQFQYVSD